MNLKELHCAQKQFIENALIKIEEYIEATISRIDYPPVRFIVPCIGFNIHLKFEGVAKKPQILYGQKSFICSGSVYQSVFFDGSRSYSINDPLKKDKDDVEIPEGHFIYDYKLMIINPELDNYIMATGMLPVSCNPDRIKQDVDKVIDNLTLQDVPNLVRNACFHSDIGEVLDDYSEELLESFDNEPI